MSTAADIRYMARAIGLARRGLRTTTPNPRVGCVLVRDEQVVGEGWHVAAGEPHAEVNALAAAGGAAAGSTAYVTLEPCCHHGRTPPCADALIAAGVARVAAAMRDPDPRGRGKGLARLAAAGIAVAEGPLAQHAAALNPGYISRMTAGRPYVRCKLAMSMDGRTAMASGESRWITGPAARRDVQSWRARSCAILVGVGTIIHDDPGLTIRAAELDHPPEGGAAALRQPVRIVADSNLRAPPGSRVFRQPGTTLIATVEPPGAAYQPLREAGATVVPLAASGGRVELRSLMGYLARLELNEVLLEGGSVLAGAMQSHGLIDEFILYMAPMLLGHRARPLLELPGLDRLAQRIVLEPTDVRLVGDDLRIIARPRPA